MSIPFMSFLLLTQNSIISLIFNAVQNETNFAKDTFSKADTSKEE